MRPRQQVLACIAPVERQHPPAVAGEVGNLLARRNIVEGNDSCIASRREEFRGRRESDAAHGMHEAGK